MTEESSSSSSSSSICKFGRLSWDLNWGLHPCNKSFPTDTPALTGTGGRAIGDAELERETRLLGQKGV